MTHNPNTRPAAAELVANSAAEEDAARSGADTLGFGGSAATQVSSLEPALWRRLNDPANLADCVRAWLALQCQLIDGASRGLVVLATETPNNFEASAFWPEGSGSSAALGAVAEVALRERRGVASGDGSLQSADPVGLSHVAFPVLLEAELKGAVAISLRGNRPDDVKAALRQLQWGVVWIRDRMRQSRVGQQDRLLDRSSAALDLLGGALDYQGFEPAAMATVTSLAVRCACSRVSLGFLDGPTVSVKIISHSAQFGRQMNLVSCLGAAMDEALDQRSLVLYPSPPDMIVATSAHAELSRAQQDSHILTTPLLVGDHFVGAMTFERASDEPFDPETIKTIELVASVIGPILEEKRLNDRWIGAKIWESFQRQIARLIGPGYFARKIAAIAFVGAIVLMSLLNGEFQVKADAQIEGLVRRAVVAPYDGFLKDAGSRAGDTVEAGAVLASLEDRDLLLERLKWITERQQHLFEYDKALATRQPATINVVRTQIDQADAQIKLIDEQLSRTKLRSPIAGQIVSGDLSQLIGAAVQRGQVLFEIAPLESYRVILDVDEREIGFIEPRQKGELVVTALPNDILTFVIDKITPLAEARSGRNVFRVEGLVDGDVSALRPGMEGLGKIDIGRRNQAWIWLHPIVDWWRIWSWRWTR